MPTETAGNNSGDDHSGVENNYIDSSAPTTVGTGVTWAWTGSHTDRFLIIFTGLSGVSGPVSVSDAEYFLWDVYSDTTHTIEIHRLLRDHDETQETWNVWSTGNSWTTAGAAGSGTDIASSSSASVAQSAVSGAYISWNTAGIATLVEGWINSTFANYGVRFRNLTASGDRYLSMDDASTTDGQRPYLSFTYTAGGGTIFDYTNTEGATASDTITAQMIENESNTEGVIGSDSNIDQLIMSESITEGSKAGDTIQEILIKIEAITEGILAGDTVNEVSVLVESITEGSVAADFESYQVIFDEILTEGILVSDLIQELMVFGEVTTETALAGDFDGETPTDLIEGPIKITVSVKQQGFTIETKQATISLTIKKPTFTTEIG